MLSEKQAVRRREKIITWLIAIAVALALLIAFVVVIKNQTKSPAKVSTINKMSLDVHYSLFRSGYTVPVFTIKNLQNTAVTDCEMTINGKYVLKVQEIPSNDNSQDLIILKTNDFVREDGAILNPSSDPVRSACMVCKKPFYDNFCGNFSR